MTVQPPALSVGAASDSEMSTSCRVFWQSPSASIQFPPNWATRSYGEVLSGVTTSCLMAVVSGALNGADAATDAGAKTASVPSDMAIARTEDNPRWVTDRCMRGTLRADRVHCGRFVGSGPPRALPACPGEAGQCDTC